MIDISYSYTDEYGTTYRLSPNPDGPANSGFSYGAVLEWCDDSKSEFKGTMFIPAEAFPAISKMFEDASLK